MRRLESTYVQGRAYLENYKSVQRGFKSNEIEFKCFLSGPLEKHFEETLRIRKNAFLLKKNAHLAFGPLLLPKIRQLDKT